MQAVAKGKDLIYATGGCSGTCILSYPEGKLVGTLDVGNGGTACADTFGNVYITDQNAVLEFAHGGTTPVNTYPISNATATTCSVDSTTGDLAVAVNQSSGYDVAIFSSPSAPPMTYTVTDGVAYCGYDDEGNLFADGRTNYGLTLNELPKHGGAFKPISINVETNPGQVQWDGKYLALEGFGVTRGATVYRLNIAGYSATVAHRVRFKGITKSALLSWIWRDRIFIPYGIPGDGPRKTRIGIWKYPGGGKPLQVIKISQNPDLQAVAFSAGAP
ncbi:MAG: hypothetical protein WBW76_00945 [Candidatus Cybelea sp.]